MPAPWAQVAASPDYQALPPDQQEAARRQYFDQVVAPKVPAGDLDLARAQFDAFSRPQQRRQAAPPQPQFQPQPRPGAQFQQPPQQAKPGPWNQTERMLLGFATPAVGIMQGTADVASRLGIIGKDQAQGYDDAAKELEAAKGRLRGQVGLAPGAFDVHDTVGEAINPLNYAVKGAGLLKGAAMGATTGAMQPTTSGSPIYERVKNAAEGAATGLGLGVLARSLGPARQAILNVVTPSGAADRAETQAVKKVLQRFSDDEKGGGPSATEAIAAVNAARARGTPMALADAGGKNVQGLAGSLARTPGPPKSIAEQQSKAQLAQSGKRLSAIGAKYISSGPSMHKSVDALRAAQQANASPLYEKAFAPGSVAPLEKQFEGVFRDTSKEEADARKALTQAQNSMTLATAKVARAGNNVYAANAALREQAEARVALQQAQQKAQAAAQAKNAVLSRLREAQAATAAGQRGGVWSPRIHAIISDPIMKPAIARGLQVQRVEALADRRQFNPNDYAVTGYDKSGNPIVGRVPNMKLLDSIKKGMDAIIEDFRDPLTGKLDFRNSGAQGEVARSLARIRRDFLNEIDAINPVYKQARAAWAGPAHSEGLILRGRNIFRMHPEEVEKIYSRFSPADREFFKLGVADWWRDEIAKAGPKSPAARALDKNDFNDMVKDRIRPLFDSQKKFDEFLQAVTDERTIFVQAGKRLGGSQTAEREVENAELGIGAAANTTKGIIKAAGGNYFGAVGDFLKAKRDLGIIGDKKVNEAMARLLFDPSVNLDTQRGRTLLSMVPSPRAKAYIENFRRAGTLAATSRQGQQDADQPQDAGALGQDDEVHAE